MSADAWQSSAVRAGDWLADQIADWKGSGLTDIVSLLEGFEVRETRLRHEADCVPEPVSASRISRFRIAAYRRPSTAHTLWVGLGDKVRNGQAVGIHCRASIGRAGLITAGVLVHLGDPLEEAWRRTSAARGRPVPDTEEQRQWLERVFRNALG